MILFGICLSLSDLLQKYWGFSSSLSIKSLFTFYFLERIIWSSCCGSVEVNLTSNYEDTGLIPDLAEWIKVPALPWAVVYVTDSAQIWFLWLWCRPAVMAPIWTLAWELPYATCVALKRQKEKKKRTYLCTRFQYHLYSWSSNLSHPISKAFATDLVFLLDWMFQESNDLKCTVHREFLASGLYTTWDISFRIFVEWINKVMNNEGI